MTEEVKWKRKKESSLKLFAAAAYKTKEEAIVVVVMESDEGIWLFDACQSNDT